MNISKVLFTILLLSALSTLVNAEVVVIVHQQNTSILDKNTVSALYFGKIKQFPNGQRAIFIAQEEGTTATSLFYKNILQRSPSHIRALWAKLIFTAKSTPPKTVSSDEEVKSLVANSPGMIGYINAEAIDDSIKVIRL